jgi:hypothetical protein
MPTFDPSARRRASPMLVDLQITFAPELERKAAVLGELLQHVVEEPDARRDMDGRCLIQIDADIDVSFPGAPAHLSTAGRQGAEGRGPTLVGRSISAYAHAAHSKVGRELQVGVAIADDRTGGQIDAARTNIFRHQGGVGLAAAAGVALEVRTDEDRIELDPLRAQRFEDELLRLLERCLRKRAGPEPVLIGDHHQPVALARELRQRGENAGHEPHFFQRVDLLVRRLFHQSAVAIDEEGGRGPGHDQASSNRLFCSGVPTVTRRARPSPG